jgi:hypothetical protein
MASEIKEKQKTKLDYFKEQYLENPKSGKKTRKTLLAGASLIESVLGAYGHRNSADEKPSKKMPEEYLFEIIKGDPTSIVTENAKGLDEVQKVGGYTQWLVNQYFSLVPEDFTGRNDKRYFDISERLRTFFEDMYKVHEDLTKFNRFKKRLDTEKHDIHHIANAEELYELVKDFSLEEATQTKAEIKLRVLREDADLQYEDENWEIIIPKTPLASYELAGPPLTRWCTASSQSGNYHDHYSKNGPLYILRDKKDIVSTGTKGLGAPRPLYQFHFHTSQYMNAADSQIEVVDFLNKKGNEGLKAFFRPMFESAFNQKDFNVEDRTFKTFCALYGMGEETKKMVLGILKSKIQQTDEVTVQDNAREYQGFVEMLKHEEFITYLFEYLKPTTKTLEITYSKYEGEGVDIPARFGELTNLTNVVFSGFVKSLPDNIGNLTNLELVAMPKNKNLKSIPASFGKVVNNIAVFNVADSGISINEVPQEFRKKEADGDLLLVFN